MRTLERLGASDLMAVMTTYRDALRLHQEAINRLNVYPVPDGDTGTNMALTVRSVAEALPAPGADLATVATAISRGALMGARGNSGVILSQILRGLSDALSDAGGVDGPAVVDGLTRAADGAYQAVERPVEGTILTVARAAADGATGAAGAGKCGLVEVLDAARVAAADALARTPDLLPVLRDANVVDSGGTGLLLLFDAFLHITDGRPMPLPDPTKVAAVSPHAREAADAEDAAGAGAVDSGSADRGVSGRAEAGCRYEVMYLLEAPDASIAPFREVWSGLGDSIVVVGGDGLYNCHIHTDDIGAAVEAGLDAGRPRQIRVSDLWDEVEEERWVREAAQTLPPERDEARVACGVVAVCAGDGVARIFRSLGANRIVTGGQSMNPSTAELLSAIDDAPADEVMVLPNNKNVVAVALTAASQSSKTVRVVPTRSIPEGFAALLDYDPEADAEANEASMLAGTRRVLAGEVTAAVRTSRSEAGPIAAGDFIGITGGAIVVVEPTLSQAATNLLSHLIAPDHHDIVTVIAGEGSTPADTRRITSWLEDHHAGISVEVHQGGQPLYPYYLSVE
jgi:DAK2 domain fusion protein YloV